MNVELIPIVMGALGTPPRKLIKHLRYQHNVRYQHNNNIIMEILIVIRFVHEKGFGVKVCKKRKRKILLIHPNTYGVKVKNEHHS